MTALCTIADALDRSPRSPVMFLVVATTCVLPAKFAHAQTVELTVVNQAGNSIETHQWAQTLQSAGFDRVRIVGERSASRNTRPSAERARDVVLVTGILDASSRLRLPGDTFSRGDRERISQWVERMRTTGGQQAVGAGFGFQPDELLRLNKRFAAVRVGSTKGRDSLQVLNEIADQLSMRAVWSASARADWEAAGPVLDQLEGLSAGTAIAAVLRPWGLALVPAKSGEDLVLTARKFQEAPEFWPVGWPPRERINKIAPKLFERELVEIRDVPLAEALSALQPLMELPFLFDHNGMARQDIDPDVERVSFPSARTLYKRVLDRALTQAKLKSELRVDEAGKPFVWISPIRNSD